MYFEKDYRTDHGQQLDLALKGILGSKGDYVLLVDYAIHSDVLDVQDRPENLPRRLPVGRASSEHNKEI